MNKKVGIGLGIISVAVIGFSVIFMFFSNFSKKAKFDLVQNNTKEIQSGETTKIFLTVMDGGELIKTVEGELFGCDDKLLPVDLGEQLSPRESLVQLLKYVDEDVELYNALSNGSAPVVIKNFNVTDDGTATVNLTGDGIGGGMCDAPRIIRQIDETLLQFTNINKTEIYFNDELIGDYLSEKDSVGVLLPPMNDEIYLGAYPDFGGTEDHVTAQEIQEYNKLVGGEAKWAYFSNNWGTDGVSFPHESIDEIVSTGSVPFIRMMPRKLFDTEHDETFSLQKIIDGNFDSDLHKYASDVRDYDDAILMDFAVEPNGDWFPWSGVVNGGAKKDGYGDENKADGPERFVDAYRHIIDIFRSEDVTNVTWFFHPDVYSYPENQPWNEPKEYYPGDEYIDWIGMSVYGPQNPSEDYWQTFSEIITERKDRILEISNTKPLALLEFGVTDHHPLGTKVSWIADAFDTILDEGNPVQFSAISWWHENWEEDDDLWATLRIDSSPGSQAIFSKYISGTSRFKTELIFE